MTFKQNDLIEFDDGEKVMVLDAILHRDNEYVFVNVVTGDKLDPTDYYKVMFVDYSNGTLKKVVDEKILEELVPRFKKDLEDTLDEIE